jgi:hypothetical protein
VNRGYRFGGLNPPATQPTAASIGSIPLASCAMQNWRKTAALRKPADAHEIHARDVPPSQLSQK